MYYARLSKCTQQLLHLRVARDVSVLLRRGQGNNPYSMATTRLRAVEELLAFKSSVIWLVTPQETFRSGSGYYNASALGRDAAGACARRVPAVRSAGEWRALRAQPRVLAKLAGVVELDGLNGQGHAKIGGGGAGVYGDCQHFCMPGVPDLLARAVFAMLGSVRFLFV